MNKKKISICIPVFNEAQNLPVAVAAVENVFAQQLPEYELEIVVTDNGSTDSTWKTVQELGVQRSYLKGYRFSRNFGYQNSVFAGLFLSTGDAAVELDADLEDPPEIIPQFVRAWEQGNDVVYGVRSSRHAPWFLKIFFSLFYKILRRLSDLQIPENSGDFRLLDRKALNVLRSLPERNLYLRGLVTYLGFKQFPIVYKRNPRLSGVSKFKFVHYIVLAIDALTAFSKTPLRMIGWLGGFLFLVASVLALYYLASRLIVGTPIPGFTTLIVVTLMLHSVTFIFLGILGEYLSRIFDDSKNRPRLIIADSVNSDSHPLTL